MGCVGQSEASIMKLGLFSPRLSLLSNLWNDQDLVNISCWLHTSSTSSSCPYQPMHQTPPYEPQVLDTCSWQTNSYVSSLICLHPCNCNYWRHVKTLEMTCLLLLDICRGASIHPLLLELLNVCICLWIISDPLVDLCILLWVFTHPLSFTMLQTGCLCLNSCLYLCAMNVCNDFVMWGKLANCCFWWTAGILTEPCFDVLIWPWITITKNQTCCSVPLSAVLLVGQWIGLINP